MKTIQKITEIESERVSILIEKRNALFNLKILLEKEKKQSELYKRCLEESEVIEREYRKWWNDIFSKYHLNEIFRENLLVDAVNDELQII